MEAGRELYEEKTALLKALSHPLRCQFFPCGMGIKQTLV